MSYIIINHELDSYVADDSDSLTLIGGDSDLDYIRLFDTEKSAKRYMKNEMAEYMQKDYQVLSVRNVKIRYKLNEI